MGLDLTLLPFDGEISADFAYSHTMLPMSGDESVFRAIGKMGTQPVPMTFHSFTSRDGECEGAHYGQTWETPYGDPLTCVTARALLKVLAGLRVEGEHTLAAIAYLKERDPSTKVALYWH